jgi:hypothetical protein
VPPTRKVLERDGITPHEVDAFKVNEASASVVLAWLGAVARDPSAPILDPAHLTRRRPHPGPRRLTPKSQQIIGCRHVVVGARDGTGISGQRVTRPGRANHAFEHCLLRLLRGAQSDEHGAVAP